MDFQITFLFLPKQGVHENFTQLVMVQEFTLNNIMHDLVADGIISYWAVANLRVTQLHIII